MVLPKQRSRRVGVGIDPSSNQLAAVWALEDTHPRGRLAGVKLTGTPSEKAHQAASWTTGLIQGLTQYGPVYVWVEDPYVGKFLNAVLPLARTQGAVLAGCHLGTATFVDNVRPSDWKRITGSGNADKTRIANWVAAELPVVYEAIMTKPKYIQQDFCDAAAIMMHGMRVLSLT